ncbi:PIN domain-containing protein [Paraburkholderia sp. SEWSISQ10-3 4]|uniref:PIN domain-containing protein n=1 Tax=Paraburkholderia TaxID=1822464 RepID=UPI0022519ACC|nr:MULTISPECIES: PIN domain-containing protein [Paraburkholderia]MCX4141116.1 PIN domain-containing protein [Paraburkholderia aspalathi]MDN7173799.1 PIN domain-containing protein [Paraburkholderia sp. SEWSISQ10-3 4]MDQ6503440.1 PIN domain-containing protein [Paraburkholderia aspalathi]
MLHVVLDTNILHQEGLYSTNMRLLQRLAESGEVQIHIPEFVKREFLTKKEEQALEHAEAASRALAALGKRVGNRAEFGQQVAEALDAVAALEARIVTVLEDDFQSWVDATRSDLPPFDPASITAVFDGYFTGSGPYRKAKCREDIPDAVISTVIERLAALHPGLYVVVRDSVLQEHLSTIENVISKDDLATFLASAEVQQSVNRIDAELTNVELGKAFMRSDRFLSTVSAQLRLANDALEHVYLEDDGVTGASRLEMNSFGANVNTPSPVDIGEIAYGDPVYLKDGKFSLPTTFNTTASIHFCASYSDYIQLKPPRSETVEDWSMNGDGICDLTEIRRVSLTGTIELELDLSAVDKLGELLPQLAFRADSLELEISSAEIL